MTSPACDEFSSDVLTVEEAQKLAADIHDELGGWMISELGDAGLRDAIHDQWPVDKTPHFWELDDRQQDQVFNQIYALLYI